MAPQRMENESILSLLLEEFITHHPGKSKDVIGFAMSTSINDRVTGLHAVCSPSLDDAANQIIYLVVGTLESLHKKISPTFMTTGEWIYYGSDGDSYEMGIKMTNEKSASSVCSRINNIRTINNKPNGNEPSECGYSCPPEL